jgi:hypothetical protein
MKNYRFLPLFLVFLFFSAGLSAQTADDVINNYIAAIGGKANLSKITSLQIKSSITSDMFEADAVATILDGKGFRMQMDVMDYQSINCWTDQGGWRTDPMTGTTEQIPDDEYRFGKGQIYIGGPWLNYKEIGFNVEMVGRADVNGVNAFQIRFTMDGIDNSIDYFFDPDTHLLIRSNTMVEAQGMELEVITTYKDYKEVEGGVKLAHVQDISYGGQMSMTNSLGAVEVNIPVDPAIFAKE